MDAEGRGAEHPSLPAARQEHSRRRALHGAAEAETRKSAQSQKRDLGTGLQIARAEGRKAALSIWEGVKK